MEIKNINLHKYPSKRWFTNGIHSLLKRADARGSANIIYICEAYRYFAGQAELLTSQSRSRTGYLLQTDSIIMRDWYFSLTNKFNLIGRRWYNLIRFGSGLPVLFGLLNTLSWYLCGNSLTLHVTWIITLSLLAYDLRIGVNDVQRGYLS